MIGTVMLATVLLYSGVENPSWQVPADKAAGISGAIKGMAEVNCDRVVPPGLGYTGVRLSFHSSPGGEEIWTFANGIAVSGQKCFADAGRRIERMLLETGRSHIDATVFGSIFR